MGYGKELIIDLKDCDSSKFTRKAIEQYMIWLCGLIDMKRSDLHFWDDVDVPEEDKETEPHLKGTSAIQFITTSNITIHTLDLVGEVYVNIFSCKDFDERSAATFTRSFFGGNFQASGSGGKIYGVLTRGRESRA